MNIPSFSSRLEPWHVALVAAVLAVLAVLAALLFAGGRDRPAPVAVAGLPACELVVTTDVVCVAWRAEPLTVAGMVGDTMVPMTVWRDRCDAWETVPSIRCASGTGP